jgi:hypothetical protein
VPSPRWDRVRVAGLILLALAALGALGWYVARNLERSDARVWVGYHGEAETNGYLAASRLLTRLGRETHPVRGIPLAKAMGKTDALILPNRRLRLTPGQVKDLKAWVEGGGLLVAEGTFAENADSARVSDPLFQAFGARMVQSGLEAPAYKPGEAYKGFAKRLKDFEEAHGVVEVNLNGAVCRVDLGAYNRIESAQEGAILGADGKFFFDQPCDGTVLLFTSLDALGNGQIAAHDHADFAATLVSRRPAGAKVWIVYQEEPPSLAAWLRVHAWMVLIALALLILLGLWRGLRRLGPPLPDPVLDRRSLLEHLAAAGRFQWSVRGGEALLAASQAALKERLWRAHPALAALPPEALIAALAERSGLPEMRVFKALRYGRHADARDFTEAIQTLELLRTLP